MSAPIQCPACRGWLLEGVFNRPEFAPCPACGVPLQIEIFPAQFRPPAAGPAAEALVIESEAACFYHPEKKAARACEGCGRFVCALCDCELHGQHFCPACLESGKTKGKIKSLDTQRTLHDSIALVLALAPLLIFYFTIFTAPMTLFLVVRHWNSPLGLLRRSKIRFVLAGLLALLQIGGWLTLLVVFLSHH